MFQVTTAINKVLNLKARKKVIQGGTSAGKTYAVIAILIDWCARNPNKKCTVVAETVPAVKDGALKIFKEIMLFTGRWNESRFNITERTYTYGNGCEIQFKSFDSIGKAHAAGKRHVLFINEGNYVDYQIADALITRTTEDIYIDFNPTNEFWAHTEILGENDAEFLLLKYHDNEALPETTLEELQIKIRKSETSDYWKNWCRVYIDGEIGNLEGVIFSDWKQIDALPEDAVLDKITIDFGFTNSYTAILARYRWNGLKIFHELCYERQMNNTRIAEKLRPYTGMVKILADSEDPRTINELVEMGIDVKGVSKGKDSVRYSIEKIQENQFFVTSTSTNLIKELRGYVWDKDKTGKPLNEPVKKNDHLCDAMRYGELEEKEDEIEYFVY